MNISIFGLGYVGAVSLACLARDGHRVIGVDIDPAKLDLIAAGKTPGRRGGHGRSHGERRRQRPRHGHDGRRARRVRRTELSLICVGTPSAPNGSQDQSAMLRLAARPRRGDARQARAARRSCSARRSCRARSRTCCCPIIEQESGKREGVDFHVCFQPEFLREGSSIRDYDKPPFTIVGARADRAGRRSCASCSATCRASSTRRRSAPRRWSSTAATTSTR